MLTFSVALVSLIIAVVPYASYLRPTNVPIRLYGRIVDQHGEGVSGVKVYASVIVEDLFRRPGPLGGPQTHQNGKIATTDERGDFKIAGRGTRVHIEPFILDGYQQRDHNWDKWEFRFPPLPGDPPAGYDAQHRYVYPVWKKEVPTEPLISGTMKVRKLESGVKYTINLLNDRTEPGEGRGDVRVLIQAPVPRPQKGPFDWSFRIEAVDGGLIETEDAFRFLAPEKGYVPSYAYPFHATDSKDAWKGELERDFYLRCRDGRVYATLAIRTTVEAIEGPYVTVSYALNPSGSRNLQPDPEKRIILGQTPGNWEESVTTRPAP